MKPSLPLGLAFLASLLIVPSGTSFAQEPPEENPLEVEITSASNAKRNPLNQNGFVSRIGLRPGQVISIGLKFNEERTGEQLIVSSPDGGVLSGHDNLSISSTSNASFSYQAGAAPGLYRIVLQTASEEYLFEFYVLDLTDPTKNPPRVRIVD